jgi:WD40 repeat protein
VRTPNRSFKGSHFVAFVALVGTTFLAACGASDGPRQWIERVAGHHADDVATRVGEVTEKPSWARATNIALSPDGEQLAVSADGRTVTVWDWRKARIVESLKLPDAANPSFNQNALTYSPDGHALILCVNGGVGDVVARSWSTSTWQHISDIVDRGSGLCSGLVVSADSRTVIWPADRGSPSKLTGSSLETGATSWHLSLRDRPKSIAIAPAGDVIAISGTQTEVLKKWSPTQEPAWNYFWTITLVRTADRSIIRAFHVAALGAVSFSADGSRLAVVGTGYIEIRDVATGDIIVEQPIPKSDTLNVRFSPNGRYLIESDEHARGEALGVTIWDYERRRQLQHISGNIQSIGTSADGRFLAVAIDGTVTIWALK